jgi:hypothetical protein
VEKGIYSANYSWAHNGFRVNFMSRCLAPDKQKSEGKKQFLYSGDTGAVASRFPGRCGSKVIILYPSGR